MEQSGLRSGHWAEIAPALNGWYNYTYTWMVGT